MHSTMHFKSTIKGVGFMIYSVILKKVRNKFKRSNQEID